MLSQSLVRGLNFHFEVMEWIERGDMIIICLVRPKYKDRLHKGSIIAHWLDIGLVSKGPGFKSQQWKKFILVLELHLIRTYFHMEIR